MFKCFFFNDKSVAMLQNAGCSARCMLLWISSACSWYFIYDKDKLEWQYFFCYRYANTHTLISPSKQRAAKKEGDNKPKQVW